MYVCSTFTAIEERYDVWVLQFLQDVDFTEQVVFELLVELR